MIYWAKEHCRCETYLWEFNVNASDQKEQFRTLFCYLDEIYANQSLRCNLQITSLTGVFVASDKVIAFRRQLFSLMRCIFLYDVDNIQLPETIPCHANELFSYAKKANGESVTDSDRKEFLRGLISIVNDMEFHIVRIGYRRNEGIEELRSMTVQHNSKYENYSVFEKEILLEIIFSNFLPPRVSHDEQRQKQLFVFPSNCTIYYCVENDNSYSQQKVFQKDTSTSMWRQEFIGNSMSVNFDLVGGVYSYTKGEVLGVLPDCIGYLLHQRWLEHEGYSLSPFKSQLAKLCDEIRPALLHEPIVDWEMMNSKSV